MNRLACHVALISMLAIAEAAGAATVMKRYYAHDAVEDQHGVIAPWYQRQNGQWDERVRIAAETLKRYPWTGTDLAVSPAPHYVYNGAWKIASDGTITIPPIGDWANGDLGQRVAYVLSSLVDYYRYSGDPAAIAHISVTADAILDHCQTADDHPWPGFLISVPVKGKVYGQADPHGFIQLDIVAEVGIGMVRAWRLVGNDRWFDAACHWADLLAEKRNRTPGVSPWGRYANAEDVHWEDLFTGGVAYILEFFDELIEAGYTGRDNAIIEARQAGIAYLRDVLLPKWTENDTWGRNYWDWPCHVQAQNVTEFAVRYLMEHPDEFPNWRNDARNVLSLFINHTSVSPESNGDVYSGAWAFPESCGCCQRSLWYAPIEQAPVYAQYGVLADSEWGREMARRQMTLATYDYHPTGVVEDNIDGGAIVAGSWFKITHPMTLKYVLAAIGWLPEIMGASRENHIVRSTSILRNIIYGDGLVAYTAAGTADREHEVLRLSFIPTTVEAHGRPLKHKTDRDREGYHVKPLPDGDCIVTIRHGKGATVIIKGDDDPQTVLAPAQLAFTGAWSDPQADRLPGDPPIPGSTRAAAAAGAEMSCEFTGSQVRLIGCALPTGGKADVYLDGVKHLCGIDAWNPQPICHQVLYHRSGLDNNKHTLRIVLAGERNPVSQGSEILVEGVQCSAAEPTAGRPNWGQGGGPRDAQRVIFGYAGRADYVDSDGSNWRPATEFVIRAGEGADSVAKSWYTTRRQLHIAGTDDAELYRYGVHGPEFWADFTVGPGTYHVRLKFAETRKIAPHLRGVTVLVNNREVATDMDIAATAYEDAKRRGLKPADPPFDLAAGMHRAVDLVVNDVSPEHGVISIRFKSMPNGEAMIQAIEVGPGHGGEGATPVAVASRPG